jgi:hypothetical protein
MNMFRNSLLAASTLLAAACTLPDVPVPLEAGSHTSTPVADGGSADVESGTAEQPDGDATVMAEAGGDALDAGGDAALEAATGPDDGLVEAETDSPACTNACALGLTECGTGVVQTCKAQANGCTGWVTTTTCGAHQACTVSGADAGAVATCTCNASVCTQEGKGCQDQQTLVNCALDADGCLVGSTSPCPTGQSCGGTQPNASCSAICQSSCTSGQTSCVSGSLATCTLGSNGCYSYGTPVGCQPHQSCTGSSGTAACTCNADPVCSAVGNACASSTTLATCAKDAQNCVFASTTSTCTNGACSAGACCTNTCTQGQTSCVSGSLATCAQGSNGCWAYGAPATCGGTHLTCTGSAGSAQCSCAADPYCSSTASVCASATAYATCGRDTQGCYYATAEIPCAANASCQSGACLLDNGVSCTAASQCLSNVCTGFYVDADGDGYGAGPSVGFCGTTPPPGYSTTNTDCCDVVTDGFNVHPGQTAWYTSPAPASCGSTWDYNCDNAIEQEVTRLDASCTPAIGCPSGTYWYDIAAVPACGVSGNTTLYCITVVSGSPACASGGPPAALTQGCH